ncbi:MAG: hypothetical protein WCF72_22560, partial [Pseudolabrys sp.]
ILEGALKAGGVAPQQIVSIGSIDGQARDDVAVRSVLLSRPVFRCRSSVGSAATSSTAASTVSEIGRS